MSTNLNTAVVVDLNKVIAVLQAMVVPPPVPAATLEDRISRASVAWNNSPACAKRRRAHRFARANWIKEFLAKSGNPLSPKEWKDLLAAAVKPPTEDKK